MMPYTVNIPETFVLVGTSWPSEVLPSIVILAVLEALDVL